MTVSFSISHGCHASLRLGARCVSFVLCALAFTLAGCASHPMRVALTELGTTSNSEYGAYDLHMMRSVTVTGLGPEEVVGSLSSDPDKWSAAEQFARFWPERNDLPDAMSLRLTSGPSQVLIRHFCKVRVVNGKKVCDTVCVTEPASPACKEALTLKNLTDLRDTLQTYQVRIAEAAELRLKALVLNAALEAIKTRPEAAPKILQGLSDVYPEDLLTDEPALVRASLKAAALAQSMPLAAQLDLTRNTLGKPGVVITNWSREVDASASARAADAGDVGVRGTRNIRGFLILGEPRISSLQFGSDFLARVQEVEEKHLDQLFRANRNYMTHYQLRARFVVFAETLETALTARLEADTAEILKILGPLMFAQLTPARLAAVQVSVRAQFAAIAASSESGAFDAQEGYVERREVSVARGSKNDSVDTEIDSAQGTLPIISIRANISEFVCHTDTARSKMLPCKVR